LIILDFSQICLAAIFAIDAKKIPGGLSQDLVRHVALNSIRATRTKFRKEYGEIILACDDTNYWRKKLFPYYKANRKKDQAASALDWNQIFMYLNTVKKELKDHFPYAVLQVEAAEADDIIASLIHRYGNIGSNPDDEKILIVSGDKDFAQMQRYKNVSQWAPIQKKMIKTPDPMKFLYEHIIRGDSGDGVPNVLSRDDSFVASIRQKSIMNAKLVQWVDDLNRGVVPFKDEAYRNYHRNIQLIDLWRVPDEIQKKVLDIYENYEYNERSSLLNYFIENGLVNLIDSLQDY
jgi:hypothetical protein